MSQRDFEWELVDMDITISSTTSIPITTVFSTTTEPVNPLTNTISGETTTITINVDPTTSLIEKSTASANLFHFKLHIALSTLYVTILIRKRKK